MDISYLIILVVCLLLLFIASICAGLFFGMWWQARKTAEVWEKAYTHVRQAAGLHETLNTGAGREQRDPRAWTTGEVDLPFVQPKERPRIRLQADMSERPAPPQPSADATRIGNSLLDDVLDDDPHGPQITR